MGLVPIHSTWKCTSGAINFVHVWVGKSSEAENPILCEQHTFRVLCVLVHLHLSWCLLLKFMWLSSWQTKVYIWNHIPEQQILLQCVTLSLRSFILLFPTQKNKLHTLTTFHGNKITCNSNNKVFILVKMPTNKFTSITNASVESVTIAHTKFLMHWHCRQFWWNNIAYNDCKWCSTVLKTWSKAKAQ